MARIRPYENQVGNQGDLPSQRAGEGHFGGPGLTRVGQAVEDLGASAGQMQRFLLEQKGRQEVTEAQIAHVEERAAIAKDLDERAKVWKLGDPPLSESLTGIIKNRMDALNGGDEAARFETAVGAQTSQRESAQTSTHFMALARQMDAKLAGEAAVTQLRSATDTMANFVYSHPAHINLAMEQAQALLRDPNGIYAASKIGQATQDKLLRDVQEQLAVRAVQGMTKLFPNRTLQVLQQPPEARDAQYAYMQEFIPNEHMQELVGHAETEVRAIDVERRQAEAEARRQKEELSKATDASFMAKYGLHMDDPKQPPLKATEVSQAMLEERLDGTVGRAILNMLDSDAKGRVNKTDDATLWRLFQDIHRPYGDPKKLTSTDAIYKAATQRKLEPSKMNFLRNEFINAQTDEGRKIGETRADFLRGQQANITKANPAMGKLDPEGDTQLANFIYFAKAEEDRFRKENKDPNLLYNPESADYLGKQVPRFQRTLSESIKSFSEGLKRQPGLPKTEQGAPPPDTHRKPGETPQQYLDRMKR